MIQNIEVFTNQTKLVRAARYELIPQGETNEYLQIHQIREFDLKIQAAANRIRKVGDCYLLHELSEKAPGMSPCLSLADTEETSLYDKNRSKLELRKALAKQISDTLDIKFNKSYVEQTLHAFFMTHQHMFDDGAQIQEAFEFMKGKATYMNKLYHIWNRALGSGAGSFAYRFIENMDILAHNRSQVEGIKALLPAQNQLNQPNKENESECIYQLEQLLYNIEEMHEKSPYTYLSGEVIENYNRLIAGIYDEDAHLLKKGINQVCHEMGMKAAEYRTVKLQKLKKQILTDKPGKNKKEDEGRELLPPNASLMEAVETTGKTLFHLTKQICSALDHVNKENYSLSGHALHAITYIKRPYKGIEEKTVKEELQVVLLGTYIKEKQQKKGAPLTAKEEQRAYQEFICSRIPFRRVAIAFTEGYAKEASESMEVFARQLKRAIITHAAAAEIALKAYIDEMIQAQEQIREDKQKSNIDTDAICSIYAQKQLLQLKENLSIVSQIVSLMDENAQQPNEQQLSCKQEHILDGDEHVNMLSYYIREFKNTKKILMKNIRLQNSPKKQHIKDATAHRQTCLGHPLLPLSGWTDTGNNTFKGNMQQLLAKDGYFYYAAAGKTGRGEPGVIIYDNRQKEDDYVLYSIKKSSGFEMEAQRIINANELKQWYTDSKEQTYILKKEHGTMEVTRSDYHILYTKKYRSQQATKKDVETAIRFFMDYFEIAAAYERFHIPQIQPESFARFSEFVQYVSEYNYCIVKRYIRATDMKDAVAKGRIYLFLINTRYLYKEQMKNTNARRLRAFFSEANMQENFIRVNGAPVVDWRDRGSDITITHTKNSMLVNKTYGEERRYIPVPVYNEIYAYMNTVEGRSESEKEKDMLSTEAKELLPMIEKKRAAYNICKYRRYDKVTYTLGITFTLNPKAAEPNGYATKLNAYIREKYVADHMCQLSVVRATDTLLAYVLCGNRGDIIEYGSIDVEINGIAHFGENIKELRTHKNVAIRKHVHTVEKVQHLMDMYIEAAAGKIIKYALEKNAVICIERAPDTTTREHDTYLMKKEEYRKFLHRLERKLMSYTDYRIPDRAPGGCLNPLQLASENNMSPLQNGLLFMVNGLYVRNIDIYSGFVCLIDYKQCQTIESKRSVLKKMKITPIDDQQCIVEMTQKNLPLQLTAAEKKKYIDIDKQWTLDISGIRTYYDKDKKRIETLEGARVIYEITKEQKGKKLNIKELSDDACEQIFTVIRKYMHGSIGAYRSQRTYYVSPLNHNDSTEGTGYTPDHITAQLLAKKCHCMISKGGVLKNLEKTEWLNIISEYAKTAESEKSANEK